MAKATKTEPAATAVAEVAAPSAAVTSEDLKEMEARLRAEIAEAYQHRMDMMQMETESYRELLAQATSKLEAAKLAGEDTEVSVQMLYDPYDVHNPLSIKADIPPSEEFPAGQKLGWKSPRYRERRTWRGWIPICYGDEYAGKNGEFLDKWIAEPPKRLEGETNLDSYVRRMGLILCRLDMDVWRAREQKTQRNAGRQKDLYSGGPATNRQLREGVHLTGEGRTDQARPRRGYQMETPPPRPALGYTVVDSKK